MYFMEFGSYERLVNKKITNGETKMCTVLEKIKSKTASQILEMCGASDTIPVDIAQIMNFLKISLIPVSFQEIENLPDMRDEVQKKGEILGAVLVNDDNAGIFYRKGDSLNRQRFTIAHELAHCCLGDVDTVNGHVQFRMENDMTQTEVAANTFAGELLIPEQKLVEAIELLPYPKVSILTNIFKVSEAVMLERLRILNYSVKDSIVTKE